jgi:hypothetical protein
MDSNYGVWPTLGAFIVGGLALAYISWRPEFIVFVRKGRCLFYGKSRHLPIVRQKALTQFLLHELRPNGSIAIQGRVRNGRLRLSFWGRLTPGERQRIRNFLVLDT